ncbi:MAG: hypothetical protein GX824_08255 [Clostridiales bacterium]|nr:hypothetical protein [Clostridiales bacterium]
MVNIYGWRVHGMRDEINVKHEAKASAQKNVAMNGNNEKKNKNKNKNSVNRRNENKNKGSNKISESSDLVEFKKAMFGLNPSEVYEYIDIINSNLISAQQVFDKKFDEYRNNLQLITVERDSLKEENQALTERATKNESELKELREASSHSEQLYEENEKYKTIISEFQLKLESCKELINENRALKAQLADLKTLQEGYSEQESKYESELAELREINKKQVYTFAQQKNEIETKFSTERLRLLKLLQVHTYHIRQSENLLKELQKQFEQSLDSLKELNID